MAKRGRPRSFDRQTALRQAMDVFWTKGYDATSLSNLKNAMAINSPSIYAAFGCKEDLFREAVALYCATDGSEIWRAMAAAPTAYAAVETMLRVSAREFTQPNRPRGCLVVLEALHDHDGNNAVRRDLRKLRKENIEALRLRFEKGVADGELPEGPDWCAIATFYIAVQQGMSIQARDGISLRALIAAADCALAAWNGLVDRTGWHIVSSDPT